MTIASASKWLYGAYVAQIKPFEPTDIKFLNFHSGYTVFRGCEQTETVGQCVGGYRASTENKFDYSGGHMQKHATLMGLGDLTNVPLGTEIGDNLGISVAYNQPQLAGGAVMAASDYAVFLRRLLTNQLFLGGMLGTYKVPTFGPNAISAPIPTDEQWHYSLGHWVEDDPVVGDGAYSSAGAFGFYPWIDSTKTYYGIIARSEIGGAFDSVRCGRVIRRAFMTGVSQ